MITPCFILLVLNKSACLTKNIHPWNLFWGRFCWGQILSPKPWFAHPAILKRSLACQLSCRLTNVNDPSSWKNTSLGGVSCFSWLDRNLSPWLGGETSNIFCLYPYLGKWSNLTSIFFRWVGGNPPTMMIFFEIFATPFHWCWGQSLDKPWFEPHRGIDTSKATGGLKRRSWEW